MTETMTSRERVIKTLNHEPVDRIPIDLGSHMSTGISAFAYWNLREHLGISTDKIWIPDVVQFLAYVDEDILQRFHCDCILLEPYWERPKRWSPRGKYEFTVPEGFGPQYVKGQGWTVTKGDYTMRMPEGGFFFDGAWLNSWNDLDEEQTYALYAKEAERIYNETPYATNFVGYSYGGGFGGYFGGMNHAVNMTIDPVTERAKLLEAADRAITRFDTFNKLCGKYVQLLTVGDDMGMQNGPMCNPEIIHDVCGPAYTKFCKHVHNNSDIKVFMHNCGAIYDIMPYICEWGIDAINPVQIACSGMDPQALVDNFGDKIVFWGGGCCTQNVLGTATPDEVAAHVKEMVRIFSQKKGFVFNQVHNIMGNVPPENIVAMFDAAYGATA
jgi:uroporphyrinogen decarboxylase